MGYRNSTAGHRWVAYLLLITVTSSIAPLYVSAQDSTEAQESIPAKAAVAEEPAQADSPDVPGGSETQRNEAEKLSSNEELPTDSEADEETELPAVEKETSDSETGTDEIGQVTNAEEALSKETNSETEIENVEESSPETNSGTGGQTESNASSSINNDGVASPENARVGSTTAPEERSNEAFATSSSVGGRDDGQGNGETNSNSNNEHDEINPNHTNSTEAVRETQSEADTDASSTSGGADSSTEGDSTASHALAPTSTAAATEISSNSTSTEASETDSQEDATNTADVIIESGKAVALANVINIVNTNFVNSDGVVFFSNFLETVNESIDFRWLYEALTAFGCSLSNCTVPDITVNSSDIANIDNYMYVEAISGGNTIAGANSAAITTGDAYAGLNLVNVANMNFIDSNYLLITLNAFNDVNGDIVFPSADAFLSTLARGPGSASVATANQASVHNDITVDANSGDNTLETSAGGSISTGASGATSNVFNQINSSFIGGQNVTILFRIHGDWAGEVFGAPSDLVWQEGADGSVFVFDTDKNAGGTGGGNHSVLTSNAASINNNVQVVALTGENKISGAETGLISAGNAYAGANIVNLSNGTVVGRNWILAIINIFGDFTGNIAFGRPDLWVGQIIDAPKKVNEGSKLTYKFSVINNGDSRASDVTLTDEYADNYLEITDASVPYQNEAGKLTFNIGTLESGEATEITYSARVFGVGSRSREITNVVSVRSRETDNNLSDNSDTATIVTSGRTSNSNATRVGVRTTATEKVIKPVDASAVAIATDASALEILRASSATILSPDAPVIQQYITLINRGDAIIPALQYVDIMRDPQGNIIQEQVWDLGNVLPQEEIELGYTITFGSSAPSGDYTFTSAIKSGLYEHVYHNGRIAFHGGSVSVLQATNLNGNNALVLGASGINEIFSEITSARQTAREDNESLNFEIPFPEDDLFVPPLTAHSVSTTELQSQDQRTLSQWFSQLYAFISSLFSKLALAMNT